MDYVQWIRMIFTMILVKVKYRKNKNINLDQEATPREQLQFMTDFKVGNSYF